MSNLFGAPIGQTYPPLLQGTGQFVSAAQPVSGFIAGPQTGSVFQNPVLVQVPVQQTATIMTPSTIMTPNTIIAPSAVMAPSVVVGPTVDIAIDSPMYAVQPATQTLVQETVTNNFVQTPPLAPNFGETTHVVAENIDTQRLFTRPIIVERPVRSTIEQVAVPGFVAKTVTTPNTVKRIVTTVEKKLIPQPTAQIQAVAAPFDLCRALLLGLLALLLLSGLIWGLAALFRRPAAVITKPLPPTPAPTVFTLTKEQRRICRIVDSTDPTISTGLFGRKNKKIIGTNTAVHPVVSTGARKFKLGKGEYTDAHGVVFRKVTSKIVVPHGAEHENFSTGAYAPLRAISSNQRLEELPVGIYYFEGTDTEFYVTDCEEIYVPKPVIVPPQPVIPPPVIVKPSPPPLVVIPPPTVIQPEPIYDLIIETPPTLVTVTNVTTIPYNIIQEVLTTPSQNTVVVSGASNPVSYDFDSQKIIFDTPQTIQTTQTTVSPSPATLTTQTIQTSPEILTTQTFQQDSPQVNLLTLGQMFDPTYQISDLNPELASQYYNQLLAESQQQLIQPQQQFGAQFLPAELEQLPPEVLAQLIQNIQEQQANGQQVSIDQLGNLFGFNEAHSASSKLVEENAADEKI